jgi:hypothetical protein
MSPIETAIKIGKGFKVEVNTMDDLPKLADACETYCWFESARIYREMYADLMRHREREYEAITTT